MDIENKIERLLSLKQGYIITPYEKDMRATLDLMNMKSI